MIEVLVGVIVGVTVAVLVVVSVAVFVAVSAGLVVTIKASDTMVSAAPAAPQARSFSAAPITRL